VTWPWRWPRASWTPTLAGWCGPVPTPSNDSGRRRPGSDRRTANSASFPGAKMTRSPDRAVRPGDRGPADEPPRRPGSPPPRPFGHRLPWADLPDPVRAQVEQVLGAPVVTAIDQRGGFSPGVAARVA